MAAIWAVRTGLAATVVGLLAASPVIDPLLQQLWTWLRGQPWYSSPYFETLQVPIVSLGLYAAFHFLAIAFPGADMRGEADQREHGPLAPQGRSPSHAATDFLLYTVPLLVLDTLTRKHYPGWVSREEWASQPYVSLQTERLLPEAGPGVWDLAVKPVAALVLYDFAFYFLHNAFHRVQALRGVHFVHHDHAKLSWTTTNQLTTVERTVLVLLANETLKLVQAHPLSRNVFVVLFLGALAESHCNLDFAFGVDKIVPLYTGARAHVTHHDRFGCNFAPFFSHMDALFATAAPCATPRVDFELGDGTIRSRPMGKRAGSPRSWFWDGLLGLPVLGQRSMAAPS